MGAKTIIYDYSSNDNILAFFYVLQRFERIVNLSGMKISIMTLEY